MDTRLSVGAVLYHRSYGEVESGDTLNIHRG